MPRSSVLEAERSNGLSVSRARWALKADKSSLKSSNILTHVFHRIRGPRHLGNRTHPLVIGPALPVAVFIGLHFFEAVISAYNCFHTLIVTTKNSHGKPTCLAIRNFASPEGRAEILPFRVSRKIYLCPPLLVFHLKSWPSMSLSSASRSMCSCSPPPRHFAAAPISSARSPIPISARCAWGCRARCRF